MAKYTVDQERAIIGILVEMTHNGATKKGLSTADLIQKCRDHETGSKKTFRKNTYSDGSLRSKALRLSYEALENGIPAVYPPKPEKPKKPSAKQVRAAARAEMWGSFNKPTKKSAALVKKIDEAKEKLATIREGQRKAAATRNKAS